MKYICVLLCALLAVCVSGGTFEDILPKKECPPGEYYKKCPDYYEPDCDNLERHRPILELIEHCFLSRCYCDGFTVRDRSTGKCVREDKCPKKQ
ncbi:chymotrypsin inhibitor Ani s 6-like [Leguminivora glycinivorella]|uniref:chymotrypsin inhibitor Ani s 6-like n=1 Tax=Leguminivora glycinivorella TaxID=1035111 RepID=UPI00200EF6A4|nr:chymotrypsin inhibitor Ani s 6-like [Leguminivora glycinivorella]